MNPIGNSSTENFLKSCERIASVPSKDLAKKRIRGDLTFSPKSLKQRCFKFLLPDEEKDKRAFHLSRACEYSLTELSTWAKGVKSQEEIKQVAKYIVRIERLCSRNGWKIDEYRILSQVALQNFLIGNKRHEQDFTNFQLALSSERNNQADNYSVEVESLQKEALENLDTESKLDLLRRIYLLDSKTAFSASFAHLFKETFLEIYENILPKISWFRTIQGWSKVRYSLIHEGVKALSRQTKENISTLNFKEIVFEHYKFKEFFKNLKEILKKKDKLVFHKLQKAYLARLFPYLGKLTGSEELEAIMLSSEFPISLEEIISDAELFPENFFEKECTEFMKVTESWKHVLIFFSVDYSKALFLMYELTLNEKNKHFHPLFKAYIQKIDENLFPKFFVHLFYETKDEETSQLAMEKFLDKKNVLQKKHADQLVIIGQEIFLLKVREKILIRSINLLKMAKKADSPLFIAASEKMIVLAFPSYFTDSFKESIFEEIIVELGTARKLEVLQRVFFINRTIQNFSSPKEEKFFRLFSETFVDIFRYNYQSKLPSIQKWVIRKYPLFINALKALETYFKQTVFDLSPDSIVNELLKLNTFYQKNLIHLIQENEKQKVCELQRDVLEKLFPWLGNFSQSVDLKNLFYSAGPTIFLEEILLKTKQLPNYFFKKTKMGLSIDKGWEFLFIFFTSNGCRALALMYEVSLKNESKSLNLQFNEFIQNQEHRMFPEFLVRLYFETKDEKTHLLLIERLLACKGRSEEQKCKQLVAVGKEMLLKDLFSKTILLKTMELLAAAKQEQSTLFISASLELIALFFPLYLNLNVKKASFQELTWEPQTFPLNLPSLELMDEDLEKMLCHVDIDKLKNIESFDQLRMDFSLFPKITSKSVFKLLQKLPLMSLQNAFNVEQLSDLIFMGKNTKRQLHVLSLKLIVYSGYFSAMFLNKFKESDDFRSGKKLKISIPENSFDFFETWLPFLYENKECVVKTSHLFDHLLIAAYFQMDTLANHIDTVLYKRLNTFSPKQRSREFEALFQITTNRELAMYQLRKYRIIELLKLEKTVV